MTPELHTSLDAASEHKFSLAECSFALLSVVEIYVTAVGRAYG